MKMNHSLGRGRGGGGGAGGAQGCKWQPRNFGLCLLGSGWKGGAAGSTGKVNSAAACCMGLE